MRILAILLIVIVGLGGCVVPTFFLFTVDQTQHVVVTRFGEVQRVVSEPGLNIKLPVDNVTRLDKRLLRIDVPPASMPDKDSQFLNVDAYVRYRITGPRAFREQLVNEPQAAQRIGSIVIAELRAEIGLRGRAEIIGGQIIDQMDGTVLVEATTINGVASRESITLIVKERSQARVKGLGVVIEDVRIKRADFPQAVEANVFNRMRTERAVQANRLRAEGEQEYLSRIADVDRQVEIIRAEAEQASRQLRGEGEGEAISILAQALGEDAEFYSFLRSLTAYKQILTDRATVVLPADSNLFQYLQSPVGLSDKGSD